MKDENQLYFANQKCPNKSTRVNSVIKSPFLAPSYCDDKEIDIDWVKNFVEEMRQIKRPSEVMMKPKYEIESYIPEDFGSIHPNGVLHGLRLLKQLLIDAEASNSYDQGSTYDSFAGLLKSSWLKSFYHEDSGEIFNCVNWLWNEASIGYFKANTVREMEKTFYYFSNDPVEKAEFPQMHPLGILLVETDTFRSLQIDKSRKFALDLITRIWTEGYEEPSNPIVLIAEPFAHERISRDAPEFKTERPLIEKWNNTKQ